jgi:hypothetical protein
MAAVVLSVRLSSIISWAVRRPRSRDLIALRRQPYSALSIPRTVTGSPRTHRLLCCCTDVPASGLQSLFAAFLCSQLLALRRRPLCASSGAASHCALQPCRRMLPARRWFGTRVECVGCGARCGAELLQDGHDRDVPLLPSLGSGVAIRSIPLCRPSHRTLCRA